MYYFNYISHTYFISLLKSVTKSIARISEFRIHSNLSQTTYLPCESMMQLSKISQLYQLNQFFPVSISSLQNTPRTCSDKHVHENKPMKIHSFLIPNC